MGYPAITKSHVVALVVMLMAAGAALSWVGGQVYDWASDHVDVEVRLR